MSTISSVLSTAKPVDPNPGSLFYFTDTNQIAIYQGNGTYYMYNRDTSAYSSGGDEELNYSGGIFSDSSTQFYISSTPSLHYDIAYPNGSQTWADLGYDTSIEYPASGEARLYSRGSNRDAFINSGALSSTPSKLVYEKGFRVRDLYAKSYIEEGVSNNTRFGLNYTYFLVSAPEEGWVTGHGTKNNDGYAMNPQNVFGIKPHGSAGSYDGVYLGSVAVADFADTSLTQEELGIINGKIGIHVIQRSQDRSGAEHYRYWASSVPRNAIGQTDKRDYYVLGTSSPSTTQDASFDYIGRRQGYVAKQHIPEIIKFDTALNEADLNIVWKYLINKYTNYSGGTMSLQTTYNDGTVGDANYDDPTTWNELSNPA
jgi:hypothetical protein